MTSPKPKKIDCFSRVARSVLALIAIVRLAVFFGWAMCGRTSGLYTNNYIAGTESTDVGEN